jgi:hypothetical protein
LNVTSRCLEQEYIAVDLLWIGIAVVFFVVCSAFVFACERL